MSTITDQFTRWTHRFTLWPQKRLLSELLKLYEDRLIDIRLPANYYDTLPDKLAKLNVPADDRTRILAFVTDRNGPFQRDIRNLLTRVCDFSNRCLPEVATADALKGVCQQLTSIGSQLETLNCNFDRYIAGPTQYGGPSRAELDSGTCQRSQSVSLGSAAGKAMLTPEHRTYRDNYTAIMNRVRADELIGQYMSTAR